MKSVILCKKKVFIVSLSFLTIILMLLYLNKYNDVRIVMGGRFQQLVFEKDNNSHIYERASNEEYFRPSTLPIINIRNFDSKFFSDFSDMEYSQIILPNYLLKTPDDAIINYFSILREAANPMKDSTSGCGTLGYGKIPYPIAYNFLSKEHQRNLSFKEFLKSFENILHINLIKLKKLPSDEERPNNIRYFVEIETIEGSEKNMSYFAYYYGYIYILKKGDQYQIEDLIFHGENYLCAPYHGWDYIAEAVVDFKYGKEYSLISKRYPTQQDGYVKNIYFKGTDGKDYRIEFFRLTNDTDIEIAQYRKNINGEWEVIKIKDKSE